MSESWYTIKSYGKTIGKISAEISAEVSSPWFSGHFPGDPVLPAIAQLSIVFDLIKEDISKNGRNAKVIGIKRARFKKIIRPGDIMEIQVLPVSDTSYRFEINTGGEPGSSGTILLQE